MVFGVLRGYEATFIIQNILEYGLITLRGYKAMFIIQNMVEYGLWSAYWFSDNLFGSLH